MSKRNGVKAYWNDSMYGIAFQPLANISLQTHTENLALPWQNHSES